MNQTVSRILWIIAGALLIIAGVICLMNPGTALLTMSLYLGISMLFSGVIDIVIFAKGNRYMAGSGWFLADGILTVLLSLFLLFHQTFTMLTLPYIFGMWLLFSGISKFSGIFHFEKSALNYANFYGIKIRNCSFICCNLYEACFDEADLTSSVFDRCDLSRTSFFKTNLEKVDFSSAFNFSIDPSTNRLKKTVFSEQNLRGLVAHLDIVIKEDENGPDFVQAL